MPVYIAWLEATLELRKIDHRAEWLKLVEGGCRDKFKLLLDKNCAKVSTGWLIGADKWST